MADLELTRLVVGGMDNNCFLLSPADGSPCLMIDAAAEAPRLIGMLAGRTLATVVTTHRHHDPRRRPGGRGGQHGSDSAVGHP